MFVKIGVVYCVGVFSLSRLSMTGGTCATELLTLVMRLLCLAALGYCIIRTSLYLGIVYFCFGVIRLNYLLYS